MPRQKKYSDKVETAYWKTKMRVIKKAVANPDREDVKRYDRLQKATAEGKFPTSQGDTTRRGAIYKAMRQAPAAKAPRSMAPVKPKPPKPKKKAAKKRRQITVTYKNAK